jgi:thiol-disulfide isomerase/thioredoxin
MSENTLDIKILDEIITGRVAPHIYAFTTNTVPNYIKVGDTYRSVSKRLREWSRYFPELEKAFEGKAIVDDDVYFRDYSVHQFLEQDLNKQRLEISDIKPGTYFSKEFFRDTTSAHIEDAIIDIIEQYKDNSGKYVYYDSQNKLPENYHYKRGKSWELRPNQKKAVDNFKEAVSKGRTNLLMYAVMRFGKSFTSLCCAKEIAAKIILIVSAKADVKEEWKKTVESAGNFEGFVFIGAEELSRDENAIQEVLDKDESAAIFLTLQDLQGTQIKDKHKEIFNNNIDLLIIDETHFGARAQEYGRILKDAKQPVDDKKILQNTDDDQIGVDEAEEQIKLLNAKVRLHLSGTPYRILMGSEFEKEDIISFVQFADIVNEQENWDKENLSLDNVNEWDNPYYGFPQMVRFAFNPNKSSIRKMEALKKSGVTFAFSALFETCSIKQDKKNNQHKKFQHEAEILDLLKVIDGSKDDDGLLGFLDYKKLKEGKMCRHMVMVLPYCASCDAMEELLNTYAEEFKNFCEYEIINISGVEGAKDYKNPSAVKLKIVECESRDQKTLTLTVNRMLTGSTVEQWDTMLYFKDTASPQEYDQAIFRLQNQYTRELVSEEGVIKENLKPQTLLVDFDPYRLFHMQEQKSLIYNVNTDDNGNSKLKERLQEELRISPIITMNHNKIRQVEATNILEAVSAYNTQRSIFDEVKDVPVDLSILSDGDILRIIEGQSEFGSKGGLSINPIEGEDDELDVDDPNNKPETPGDNTPQKPKANDNEDEERSLEKKVQTYYQRILFFAFLSKDHVTSLSDIVEVMEQGDNLRLAKNLGLNKLILQKMEKLINAFKLSSLDYKIQNISRLSNDEAVDPLDRALTSLQKFNRMSESEIITPSMVCDDMISLIPNEGLRNIIANDKKLLDIASKSGEYAVALYKKLTIDLGFSKEQIFDVIYSIPTSSIAYEFTRRFYEIIGLNTENIATKFTAYDLLKIEDDSNDSNYLKASCLIKQKKTFSKITLTEEISEGDDVVKFGAIVGNPPYQESDGGAQASARPIYQEFVQIAKALNPNYMSFIIPTRWYAGGKGLDKFRDQMLNDLTLKELHDFLTPEEIFPNTNNRGGVCYFILDNNYNAEKDLTRVVSHNGNGITSESYRQLKTPGLDIFVRDKIGLLILEKVVQNKNVTFMSEYTSPRKPFGLEGNFIKNKKFKSDPRTLSSAVKCYGKAKKIGYIEREDVISRRDWIDCWKVYTPYANNIGTELNDDNQNTFIGEPGSVCTETFLVIGAELQLSELEAVHLASYLRTKFARFLHSLPKISQHGTRLTYRFVPIQDFSKSSDIDWSLSIDDIDEQLFEKYGLTNEEKQHIRTSIKAMV